jgi:glycosyltransferase involved in cell wall biosynthesis
VLLVFRDARPASGGLGTVVRDVANGLADRGHGVQVATVHAGNSGGDAFAGLDPRVMLTALSPLPPRKTGLAFGLAPGADRLVRARAGSVVHVYSCVPAYLHFAAMASALTRGCPLVWTPMTHPARKSAWTAYGVKGRLMAAFDLTVPRLARHVDAVVAATRAEARFFERLGCPRVLMGPPAVASRAPVPAGEAAEFRRRFGLDGRPLVLGVSARRDKRKGMGFCFESFDRLREQVPDAVLALTGTPGPGDPRRPGLRWLGRLSDDDLARAYRAADVVFVPSLYEAFSLVVIEAWQQARPVVVTDGVALAEVVRTGGGLVVPYGDAGRAASGLANLIRDGAAADRAGREGRAYVQSDYLLPTVLDRLESLYAELTL